MKKFGFTLSEVLVALGVVAVLAAITAPILGNIMPDKNKIQVLKVYKTVSDINDMMLSDPSLYPGRSSDCEGLECTEFPYGINYTLQEQSYYWGCNKYRTLLKRNLDIIEGAELDKEEFTTGDGIKWKVEYDSDCSLFITIDLDSSSNSVNCAYSDNCKTPDQFTFYVDKLGTVIPNDALAWSYLTNPKVNNKKADKENASRCTITFKSQAEPPQIMPW